MFHRTRFSGGALLAAAALAGILGCNPTGGSNGGKTANGGSEDPIKIGLIASLNGELKPWGEDSMRGAQLAVKEFNDAGGLNGRKVELIVEDTASRPEQGKTATEKLLNEDQVLAVLGEVASGITQPAAEVCQAAGVPIIAIGATRVDITEIGEYVFRACFTDNFQGAAMAKFAYEDLGLRRVAMLTDKKQPYSTGLSDIFRKAFESFGGTIVAEEFYEGGNIDFQAQLTNIKAKNPDGLFCSGYFNEVGPIARQREALGLNVKMVGGDGWDSRELIQSGGTGIIGGFFCNHYHNSEDRDEVRNFVEAFKKEYGNEPATAMGALGYDAATILLDAIKRAEKIDPKSIRDAISTTKDLKGVSGSLSIGPDRNAQKPALVLEVKKDDFEPYKQVPFFVFEG